ncbi:MAG: LysR family transcriptional regulator [Gammaproteobacteria bacterium]|nr:LysR family transcriptional regulator [Gammaproteobacteria bacterium]
MKRPVLAQVSDLDLRLLRVFRAVVESGGFAAAELQLNIGRSTISRHIKDLEARLGMSLCRRGRGGFALTPEGAQIYQATLRVLGSLADLRSEVNNLHQRLSGTLQLALFDKTATNPEARIATAIGELRRLAPDVAIELRVHPINEIERGILDGRYHIGVIPTHRRSGACEYQRLFGETMYLYCGADHPLFGREQALVTDSDIQQLAFAGLGFHSDNMERGHEFGLQRLATAYDQEGVATFILSGAYIGFLPDHYAASFVQQGLMRALRSDHFSYECTFETIVRQEARRSRLTQTFLDLLLAAHRKPQPEPHARP